MLTHAPAQYSVHLDRLQAQIAPLKGKLATHPLYKSIHTIENLRRFTESHVYAVWDFMSLLKALQQQLTSTGVPWMPSPDPEARYLINTIVLGEESDLYMGRPLSHFELYLEAMQEAGADMTAIHGLMRQMSLGVSVHQALDACRAPEPARIFVRSTFRLIAQGRTHELAAAFTFGREDLIPSMFRAMVHELDVEMDGRLRPLLWYLERHVEVDGDEHGPMALNMVARLCGDDPNKWREATEAAQTALAARITLWDAVEAGLASSRA